MLQSPFKWTGCLGRTFSSTLKYQGTSPNPCRLCSRHVPPGKKFVNPACRSLEVATLEAETRDLRQQLQQQQEMSRIAEENTVLARQACHQLAAGKRSWHSPDSTYQESCTELFNVSRGFALC